MTMLHRRNHIRYWSSKILQRSQYFLFELELRDFQVVIELDHSTKRVEADEAQQVAEEAFKNDSISKPTTEYLDEAEKGIVIDDIEGEEDVDEKEDTENASTKEFNLDVGYMTLL